MTVSERNKQLTTRYPFLIPRNAWSGKRITDGAGFWPGSPDEVPEYNYEYTDFDIIPDGWAKAFGLELCEELREQLIRENQLEDFWFVQIKEKFGSLRMYPGVACSEEIWYILDKYEQLSERTCIVCGKPATRMSKGWICPYCNNCGDPKWNYMPLAEWLKEDEDAG